MDRQTDKQDGHESFTLTKVKPCVAAVSTLAQPRPVLQLKPLTSGASTHGISERDSERDWQRTTGIGGNLILGWCAQPWSTVFWLSILHWPISRHKNGFSPNGFHRAYKVLIDLFPSLFRKTVRGSTQKLVPCEKSVAVDCSLAEQPTAGWWKNTQLAVLHFWFECMECNDTKFVAFIALQMQGLSFVDHRLSDHCITSFHDR